MQHTSTMCGIVRASLLFTILFFTCGVSANHEALFVFGDSYADTGNHNNEDPTLYTPWRAPYGITWPGSPSGRYSNGRLFTDFYASSLNFKRPIPYRVINSTIASRSSDHSVVFKGFGGGRGINFAFGGSGVFPTFGPQYPNISAQIKQLKQLISKDVVPKHLIKSSKVLLVVAGNDYTAFLQSHAANEVSLFIPKVVAQIVASIKEFYDLGFKTITVTNLEPVGCLPVNTYLKNYTSCNETSNTQISKLHNTLLASSIASLQIKKPNAKYVILDFYNGFEDVIEGTQLSLRPCCEGINGSYCGDVNSNGDALYIVCSNPQNALFWDTVHPTNAGWKAISKALFSS